MRKQLPFLFLGLVILLLLSALWGGLQKMGWKLPFFPSTLAFAHGPLMVSGFLGTLIGVERAIAINRRSAYLGPLLTLIGAIIFLGWQSSLIGPTLLTLGSLYSLYIMISLVFKQPSAYGIVLALGTFTWLVGNSLWLSGLPVYMVVLWWMGFLVLTIAGERLMLGRIIHRGRGSQLAFLVAVGLFMAGLVLSLFYFDMGVRLSGIGMLALAVWLWRYDIALRTIRKGGLPRFTAICLLAGYVWLVIGGGMALLWGGLTAGAHYDALLHAIFLGFVFSMIFGHAPIIFTAISNRPAIFSPIFYGHLVVLHLSLFIRIIGDLFGYPSVKLWGGLFNALALLVFLLCSALVFTKPIRSSGTRNAV